MTDEKHPTPDDRDELVKIGLDPEDALKALLKVDPEAKPVDEFRWHIVFADSREPAPGPNPPNGFVTEDEALEFHATILNGDSSLIVVRVPDRLAYNPVKQDPSPPSGDPLHG